MAVRWVPKLEHCLENLRVKSLDSQRGREMDLDLGQGFLLDSQMAHWTGKNSHWEIHWGFLMDYHWVRLRETHLVHQKDCWMVLQSEIHLGKKWGQSMGCLRVMNWGYWKDCHLVQK